MSFIASLAAVGSTVAGVAGITGLGTTAAALTGAGALAAGGAGLGAATSAIMGGDPGEGALMGAVTAPLMAPLMPAASAGAAAAENVGANAATQTATEAAKQTAVQAATQAGTQAAEQAGAQGIEQLAANPLVNATTTQVVPKTVALQPLTEVATPSWGQSLIGNAFNTPVTGTMAKVGGGALENAVYGAGMNTGINALTGRPLDENLGTSALAGGIGGAAGAGLATQAGQPGVLGKIGTFAAEHPGITSTAIGLPTSMALNAATTPSAQDELEKKRMQDQSNFLRYMRNYTPSLSPGYAAGGITDLDGYMSDAQNIPNPQEVADPEGYPSNSMKLMSGGGLADLIPGGQDVANWLAKNSLPGMIFGWEGASDVPIIGGMFNDPNIANLTPEEKKKLMDNMAATQGKPVQQMAQGGIADLGGYAAGGRPNLLHGPGDGVSDDIPASIAGKQPARLASGEYVIPSRIVSELGNGSTDAGAKRLDMMVQKVNAGRAQTLGGKKYAKDTRAYKHLPV